MVDGQVVEERLAGNWLEVWRELDQAAFTTRQVRVLAHNNSDMKCNFFLTANEISLCGKYFSFFTSITTGTGTNNI